MDGEGRLTIAVRKVVGIPSLRAQSARSGDYVAISVADTGSGIAPEHLDAIFEPFFTTRRSARARDSASARLSASQNNPRATSR